MPGIVLENQSSLTSTTNDDFDEEMLEGVTWLLELRKNSKEIEQILQTSKAIRGFSQESPLRSDDKINLGVRDVNKKRKRATRDEVAILRRAFCSNPLPPQELRQKIAQELDWTPRKVKIWFQNERAKLRKRGRENLNVKSSTLASDSSDHSHDEKILKPSSSSSLSSTSLPVLVTPTNIPINRFSSGSFPNPFLTPRYPFLNPNNPLRQWQSTITTLELPKTVPNE